MARVSLTQESLIEKHAREKSGQGDGWAVFRWENLPEAKGVLLTGAVAPPLKTGPYAGKPNWQRRDRATEKRVFISHAERDAYEAKWEDSTGLCARCQGGGKTPAAWSKAEGQTYRDCPRCGGSGAKNRGSGIRKGGAA